MNILKSGNLKLQSFDLADQDREALRIIRDRTGIPSNALAVRLALREKARRLIEADRAAAESEKITAGG